MGSALVKTESLEVAPLLSACFKYAERLSVQRKPLRTAAAVSVCNQGKKGGKCFSFPCGEV